jgi:hypothetical protein
MKLSLSSSSSLAAPELGSNSAYMSYFDLMNINSVRLEPVARSFLVMRGWLYRRAIQAAVIVIAEYVIVMNKLIPAKH